MKVATSSLKGHTSSILCVAIDHTNNTSHVAAGAESGTCPIRVWDTRIDGKRCQMAIRSNTTSFQGEVTSVAFAPGHLLFCSWEQSIAAYDLRRPDQHVIQTFEDNVWYLNNFASDEINQISISSVQPSGKWKIACCEDGGDVHVFQVGDGARDKDDKHRLGIEHTCLSGVHDNLCTAVRWQHGSDRILVSGSMDATICMWNASSKKPVTGGRITCGPDTNSASTSGGTQLLNPPFVNSIDVGHRTCAVGLGDGTVGIYNLSDQRPMCRLRGHDAATACVTFVRGTTEDNEADNWNHLFSGGNDNKICLWNLNEREREEKKSKKNNGDINDNDDGDWEDMMSEMTTAATTTNTNSSSSKKKKRRNKKNNGKRRRKNKNKETNRKEETSLVTDARVVEEEEEDDTYIPIRFEHPHKINWLDASRTNDGTIRLFVADSSNDITVYTGFQ